MSKSTVLIVEDVEMLLEVTIEAFHDGGYATVAATTGNQAISILDDLQTIDLLLTDIRLPGTIDGWDIAEHARSRQPALPVIYVTGYSAVEPRRVEGSLLFLKPCRSSKLLNAAQSLGVGPGRAGLA